MTFSGHVMIDGSGGRQSGVSQGILHHRLSRKQLELSDQINTAGFYW